MPKRSYLLICYSYPPVLGGSEMEAQRVSSELQNRGHWVKIITSGGGPMPRVTDWVDPFGVRVKLIGGEWRASLRNYVYALGVAWAIFRERRNYEIVYFLMQGLQLVTGLPLARLLGKRIVMKFSCSGQVIGMQSSFIGRVSVWMLRRWADSILILNPGMAQEALEVGFSSAQIGWMPNPIDTEQFSPCSAEERSRLRRELGVGAETPLVVFVGRLDHQKKIPWLLGSFARALKKQANAVLVLVGDGPLREEMKQVARDLGVEKSCLFVGRLSAEGVLNWLRAGDVFTLISAVEGLPCSLIEAMSVGLAPVVSDIPAHSQIVDNETHGLVTELGNEEAVANGLLRLLNDAALRQRCGAAARERIVSQYSTAKVCDCYEDLFASLPGAR